MGALRTVATAVVACFAYAAQAVALEPNAEVLAFASNRDGDSDLYTMQGDGSGVVQLLNEAGDDYSPAWSPDGKRIAFVTNRHMDPGFPPLQPGDENVEIYIAGADGSKQHRLTENPAYDGLPSWSPDGQTIAFESDRDGKLGIYLMSADGTSERRISPTDAEDSAPTWAPDGRTILFASYSANGSFDIYSMKPDGSGRTALVSSPAHEGLPAWSPDGKSITFDSDRAGNLDVFRATAVGLDPVQLTDSTATDVLARWSPLGERIAFTTVRDGREDVYVMAADGSGERRLTTDSDADDADPAYRPEPRPARRLGLRGRGECERGRCRLMLRGRLHPPIGAHRATACRGLVDVSARAAGQRVAERSLRLTESCVYRGTLRFGSSELSAARQATARAGFAGNHVVAATRSSRRAFEL